jgi:hypothetical protein
MPARSADSNVCNYYVWGHLKHNVHSNNPLTMDELKQDIWETIITFPDNIFK